MVYSHGEYRELGKYVGKFGYSVKKKKCEVQKKCGGCSYINVQYDKQLAEKQEKLAKLRDLKNGLKSQTTFSLESIGDIATIMQGKKKLKKLRWTMVLTGIPVTALQWFSIIFWIVKGLWWPFVVWAIVAAVWGTIISRYYFRNVKYICPECHEVFKPSMKEAFWANHTPSTRKLTCTKCAHKGFCVEIWGGDEK